MTYKAELIQLQRKARRCGRVADFIYDKDGFIDSVFYMDQNGPGLQKTGLMLSPIAFAEFERAKHHCRKRRRN